MRKPKHDLKWIFWSGLAALQTLAALLMLIRIRRDTKNAVLFGLSASRLLLVAFMCLIFLIAVAALIFALIKPSYPRRFDPFRKNRRARSRIAQLSALLFFACGFSLWTFSFVLPDLFPAYIERLNPFLMLIFLLSGELYCLLMPGDPTGMGKPHLRKLFRPAILFLAAQVLLYAFFQITKFGITPDPFDWQPIGISVQIWQVAGAILTTLFFGWIMSLLPRNMRLDKPKTIVLFLLIWRISAFIWVSVPSEKVLNNSYFAEITAPDYVPYPTSDAAYFGLWSESILAGLGLKSSVISRQLFVAILAAVQSAAADNIWLAIDLLTVILALIPAFFFLLARQLHSFQAGILAAAIAIFRELNTLYMAPHFGVSSSKMFLSDLPMLLFFLIFLNAAVFWLRAPRSYIRLALTAGSLALAALVRSQVLLLLPVFLVIAAIQRVPKKFLAAFVLLLTVILLPALIRSLALSGSPILEDSGIHGYELARRYSDDIHWRPDAETVSAGGYFSTIAKFVRDHPQNIASFIINHFSKDILDSWLVLPAGLPPSYTINDITRADYQDIPARISGANTLGLLLTSVLIAVGLAAMRRSRALIGYTPLLLGISYMFFSAIGRYSGWRFILPADWIFYFYFAIGCVELLRQFSGFEAQFDPNAAAPALSMAKKPQSFLPGIGITILYILIAALPGLSRSLVPDRIAALDQPQMLEIARAVPQDSLDPALCDTIQGCTINMAYGRLIYPRWFAAGEGLTSANPWPVYQIRDFDRLSFILLNETNTEVILPLSESPQPLPSRAACLAVGRWSDESWFQADLLIFPEIPDADGNPFTIQADPKPVSGVIK